MTTHTHIEDEPQEHAHPQPRTYVNIAVVLTVITGLEVGLYYQRFLSSELATIGILLLSTLKFICVVAWYMHLRFDSKLFTYFFIAGMSLAALVLLAIQFLLPVIGHPDQ